MDRNPKPPAKIARRLEGEPVHVGDRFVQPVGRLTGKPLHAGGAPGGFSGVVAHLQPVEIVVRQGDATQTIPIADPQKAALRDLVMAGLAVCIGCILIMLAARYLAKRRVASESKDSKDGTERVGQYKTH
jgi:hypothetical protein